MLKDGLNKFAKDLQVCMIYTALCTLGLTGFFFITDYIFMTSYIENSLLMSRFYILMMGIMCFCFGAYMGTIICIRIVKRYGKYE